MSAKRFGPGDPRVVDSRREGTRLRGRVDGREVDVEILGRGSEAVLRIGGRALRVTALREGNVVWIQSDASIWRFEELRASGRKRTEASGHEELTAPMPSKVVRIEVELGSRVEAGAPLVVLEAMKMEHTLRAPHAGIVTSLPVSVGEMVASGQRLMEIDALPEGS